MTVDDQSRVGERSRLMRVLDLRGPFEAAVYLAAVVAVATSLIVGTQTKGSPSVFAVSASLVFVLSIVKLATRGKLDYRLATIFLTVVVLVVTYVIVW
jgi:uncharacterized membrane protein YhhN